MCGGVQRVRAHIRWNGRRGWGEKRGCGGDTRRGRWAGLLSPSNTRKAIAEQTGAKGARAGGAAATERRRPTARPPGAARREQSAVCGGRCRGGRATAARKHLIWGADNERIRWMDGEGRVRRGRRREQHGRRSLAGRAVAARAPPPPRLLLHSASASSRDDLAVKEPGELDADGGHLGLARRRALGELAEAGGQLHEVLLRYRGHERGGKRRRQQGQGRGREQGAAAGTMALSVASKQQPLSVPQTAPPAAAPAPRRPRRSGPRGAQCPTA